VNISQAAIGLAVVLIGVALVWATPRLDRFARRFAAPVMRLPSTPFYVDGQRLHRCSRPSRGSAGWLAMPISLSRRRVHDRLQIRRIIAWSAVSYIPSG